MVCRCKTGCKGRMCKCVKTQIKCTSDCDCQKDANAADCNNPFSQENDIDSSNATEAASSQEAIIENLTQQLSSLKTELKYQTELINKDLSTKNEELQILTQQLMSLKTDLKNQMELNKGANVCNNENDVDSSNATETASSQEAIIENLTQQLTNLKTELKYQTELNKNLSTKNEELQTLTQQLTTDLKCQKELNKDLCSENEELQNLNQKMDKERRKLLHHVIHEMKDNIKVFCRVRPRTPKETKQMKALCNIRFIDDCTIEVGKSDGSDAMSCSGNKLRGTKQEFSFNKVFAPNASQADVFEELSLLVQSAIEGYNVCVFAYGQTGSGKTYTMEGKSELETEGMIPRTVRYIFSEMEHLERLGWKYRIEASFLEIHNDNIVDLLDSEPKTHEIRMVDNKGQDLCVSNLQIKEIHSPEELHEYLRTAQHNREVAATQSNKRSSRSHLVARMRLIGTRVTKQEGSISTIGNLNLVDLAGCERLTTEGPPSPNRELAAAKYINTSLANLGNVILALSKKQEHVPYRNSKLTRLLEPYLGGNSKTLMLLNVSPLDEHLNETLNSLKFGSNVANNCKTGSIKRPSPRIEKQKNVGYLGVSPLRD